MKTVVLAVHPDWCKKIFEGIKTVDVRKNQPSIPTPFRCYVYETKGTARKANGGRGKIIGEFVCSSIDIYGYNSDGYGLEEEEKLCKLSCVTSKHLYNYLKGGRCYGWNITKTKIYNVPKDISEFNISNAPQSWCYYYD